jgi:hypothetical protein
VKGESFEKKKKKGVTRFKICMYKIWVENEQQTINIDTVDSNPIGPSP